MPHAQYNYIMSDRVYPTMPHAQYNYIISDRVYWCQKLVCRAPGLPLKVKRQLLD